MTRKVDTALPSLAKMKIILVGDPGVGKTCLLAKYLTPGARFPSAPKPTIGIDYASKRMDVQNVPTYVHFWDLSGDEIYIEVRNEFYPEANGIVLCYDCSNKESFDHLQNWIDEGSKYNADWAASIVVGCKSDAHIVVQKDQAAAFAKKFNTSAFQVSAKSGNGVDAAFTELLKMVQKKLG
jgi:small GTP-binding protein